MDKYAEHSFKAGDLLMHQGEIGDTAYLIRSGVLEVFTVSPDGKETKINRVEAGEFVGETALIFDEVRSASVRAVTEGILVEISRDMFKEKLQSSDPMIVAIVEMLSRRVQYGNFALLKEQKDMRKLLVAVRILFSNLTSQMEDMKRKLFEEKAMPHLEAFIESVETIEKFMEKKKINEEN